jgi:hypothetical protein
MILLTARETRHAMMCPQIQLVLRFRAFAACVLACLFVVACKPSAPPTGPATPPPPPTDDGTPRIVIDLGTKYQTMAGWEGSVEAGMPGVLSFRDQLADRLVDELGIDRVRLEIRSGAENNRDYWTDMQSGAIDRETWRNNRYVTVNDNNDPFTINTAGFQFAEINQAVEEMVLPLRQRLTARGKRLHVNLTFVAFTGGLPRNQVIHDAAEEYAEFVQATYRHLGDRYGFMPDSWEVLLEPDTGVHWPPDVLRRVMIAAGNRLVAMGVTPRFVAPSTSNMGQAIVYGDEMVRGGVPRFWAEISYHRYSGVSRENLEAIASRAKQWNLQTAMLENISSGHEDLHEDLKIGHNSSWGVSGTGFPGMPDDGSGYYVIDISNPMVPVITPARRTPFMWQYFRHIAFGAVRVSAVASPGPFDPLAFVNPTGKVVVVVKADASGALAIQGLPAGSYEATYATSDRSDGRLGTFSVGAGDLVRLTMPGAGVLTVTGS